MLERLSRGPGIRTFFAQRLECGLLKPFCRQRPNVGSPRAFERKTGALLLWMVSSLVVLECALRKTFFAITKPRLFIEHLLNKLISNACISEKGTPWQALPFPLQLLVVYEQAIRILRTCSVIQRRSLRSWPSDIPEACAWPLWWQKSSSCRVRCLPRSSSFRFCRCFQRQSRWCRQ